MIVRIFCAICCIGEGYFRHFCCRPTHVGRGLKFLLTPIFLILLRSPYARRAWVEILWCCFWRYFYMSPYARRAWVEMDFEKADAMIERSPYARRAWVEIFSS